MKPESTRKRQTTVPSFAQFALVAMWKQRKALTMATCLLVLSLCANGQTIQTIDIPAAGTGLNQGTVVNGINPAGTIAGHYIDSNNVFHGFVRTLGGAISTFDAPCAGTAAGQGTTTLGLGRINPAGVMVGFYIDASNAKHAYVRAADGAITTFDAPGAGTGAGQGTVALGINPAGTIVGSYLDASNVGHGYMRAADGTITIFDVPGAGTASGQGTAPSTPYDHINARGAVAGHYIDASHTFHGFLRNPDGSIITFDVPGSSGTSVSSINDAEAIAGFTSIAGTSYGYLRAADGTITTYAAPGAVHTEASSIDPAGAITGFYIDAGGVLHGYLRAPDGTFTTFSDPAATKSTVPLDINPPGVIVGAYSDSFSVVHGFVRTP